MFLTTYASKVTFLVREQDFTCDATVAAAAKNNPKIDVRYQIELEGATARQGGLREASILNRATGQTETWKPADGGTFGVFVFAGYVPATDLVRGVASSYVYTALSVSSSTCSMTIVYATGVTAGRHPLGSLESMSGATVVVRQRAECGDRRATQHEFVTVEHVGDQAL